MAMNSNTQGCLGLGAVGLVLLAIIGIVMAVWPQYRVYQQELAGKARYAEAESSRRIAILEAQAAKEAATQFAEAEVIRAQGAADANRILQDSLGGPEGYLRYLQIQAIDEKNASLIYVPTESGLPITEARRLPQAPSANE